MWFDNAINKEKINNMFSGELSIDKVEFENFLFYNHCSFRVVFCSKNIPKMIPTKWKNNKFNAIRIVLNFTNVIEFECKGNIISFDCTPIFEFKDNKMHVIIHHDNDYYLKCVSEFMFIDEITPHFDQRFE